MGHIFFIMGISGAGKGTLISNLKKQTQYNFHIPLSYKTRAKREHEVHGVDSFFISREEFFGGLENGEFLEYAKVHDLDYYGTKVEDVIQNGIKKGKIVIKELDILGLKKIIEQNILSPKNYTTIFLHIPSDILPSRIKQRGDKISTQELENRIQSALNEEKDSKKLCNYLIDATKSPEDVLNEVLTIISQKI